MSSRQKPVKPLARARRERNAKSGQRVPRVGRDDRKPKKSDPIVAERRLKALALRKDGESYRAIGAALGVDTATAWSDVQTSLAETAALASEVAEDVKALELERYDEWTLGLAQKARNGDAHAINALVKVSQRRARLLGIDAPIDVRNVIDVSKLTDEELETYIALTQKVTGGAAILK